MGLITVSPINNGDNGDATVVSNNFSVLANEFNGNIDNNNVKGAANIDAAKLLDNSVSVGKLKAGVINLSHLSLAADQTLTGSDAQVTGLSVSVTVPASQRSVRITFLGAIQQNADGNSVVFLKFFKDGTNVKTRSVHVSVGGVALSYSQSFQDDSPTAAVHTYNLQASYSAGAAAPVIKAGSDFLVDLV